MFGINKRVLTLGFCTLRFLTVGELKAILAHEYAHFSHSDTFYSRFIYQVHMSIEEALYGMKAAGGVISLVNPFYWFLWLYYKSYSLLAAGYSRSREFLADRMAATLYGSAQFKNALEKVSTDGTLFEMTMYNNISALLSEQKAFVNMYETFTQYRNEQISHDDRNKLYQDLLGEKGSLFASHPTFAERAEAIATLPAVVDPDDRSALELFDRPEEIEQELTKFLTDYMAYLHQLQAQAAQQG
jgi:Zn-dependent protease with chaperone function